MEQFTQKSKTDSESPDSEAIIRAAIGGFHNTFIDDVAAARTAEIDAAYQDFADRNPNDPLGAEVASMGEATKDAIARAAEEAKLSPPPDAPPAA